MIESYVAASRCIARALRAARSSGVSFLRLRVQKPMMFVKHVVDV